MSKWYRTKRFWVIAVLIAVIVMIFLSGSYIVECFRLRREISALENQVEMYRAKIAEDSIMLDNLRYDEKERNGLYNQRLKSATALPDNMTHLPHGEVRFFVLVEAEIISFRNGKTCL